MRFVGLIVLMVSAGIATAGPALDDDKKLAPTTDPTVAPDTPLEPKVEWGIDVRLRSVYVPRFLLEVFVDHAPGGSHNYGYGLDVVRRRGNFEIQLGLEFEHITATEGVWVNHGDSANIGPGPNQVSVDYILSPDHGSSLGWFSLEATFINHAPINKYVAFRYGGGGGIGIITGKLVHYNEFCSAGGSPTSLEPYCVPPVSPFNGSATLSTDKGPQPITYNLPPVFPVLNAIIGLQIKPFEKAVINIEAGIRTIPFFGVTAGYFF